MTSLPFILIVGLLFILFLIRLSTHAQGSLKLSRTLFVITSISSLLIYGYGFAMTLRDEPVYALLRTLFAVCRSYLGNSDYEAIKAAPHYSDLWFRILICLIQLLAIFTSVLAVVGAFSRDFANHFRLQKARKGRLVLIYGSGERALLFGANASKRKATSVIFVLPNASANVVSYLNRQDLGYRSDESALSPDATFIQSIRGASGRKIAVYCLREDFAQNVAYASQLKAAFEQAGADAAQLSLSILGRENSGIEKHLIAGPSYGFGSVTVFNQFSLTARLLMKVCKPWEEMHFDAECHATEDFHVLLVGFDAYNQNILKEFVRNGQFCGSTFHADIIAENADRMAGELMYECSPMLNHYDIKFYNEAPGSLFVFQYLEKTAGRLKFIVVSLGDQAQTRETADVIKTVLDRTAYSIPIVTCVDSTLLYRRSGTWMQNSYTAFTADTMNFRYADALAMEVNHTYSADQNRSAWDDWKDCDFFGRMSSRASADFMPAMLWCMGLRPSDVKGLDRFVESNDGTSDPAKGILSKKQIENLGRTEHERWMGFHYSMGYAPMSEKEWEARAAVYRQQKAAWVPSGDNNAATPATDSAGNKKLIRVGKNAADRRHACMIPWEALADLSDKESVLTGKAVDYYQIDINNVLTIPGILKKAEAAERSC